MGQPSAWTHHAMTFHIVLPNQEIVGGCGVRVAESGVEPPRTIPNRVVPGASAGEYCAGDRVGGEAVARTPQPVTIF